ncbi:MAG: glycosyltransferase family 2 protein [Muribaculaceae bacterium]|nr:glycosyltransferase family 2 protein [Muribaculaceae bacterium]
MKRAATLSIIAPCLNEEQAVAPLVEKLLHTINQMVDMDIASPQSYIILVDDGSTDSTWENIERLHALHGDKVTGVKLTHNVGHQNALLAGLESALSGGCDATITIDADLQDDTAGIITMVQHFSEGYDIVYGVRDDRSSDTKFKRNSANMFYNMMQHFEPTIIKNHADYRLMSRRATEMLLQYPERNLFLRGIVPQIGLKSCEINYSRNPRVAGKSKYPLARMINFAVEGITSFSIVPMRLIFIAGIVFMICTLAVTIYVVSAIMMGRSIPGWASMMLSLWFIGSLILIALGIIGEYVGKIYIEVKHRPRYFIDRITSSQNEAENQKND